MSEQYELEIALMEAGLAHDAREYFNARPALDNEQSNSAFDAGYKRAWNAGRVLLLEERDSLNAQLQAALQSKPEQVAVPEGFAALVADAIKEAQTAMAAWPAPNKTLLKVAEEAGEVIQAGVHLSEGRCTAEKLRKEMVQSLAMHYRLWAEGDAVNGVPAIGAAAPQPPEQAQGDEVQDISLTAIERLRLALSKAGISTGEQSLEEMAARISSHILALSSYVIGTFDRPAVSYSIDADELGIRDRCANAITGALAFGAQGINPPPVGHWLTPFWEMARAEAQQPAAAVGGALPHDVPQYVADQFGKVNFSNADTPATYQNLWNVVIAYLDQEGITSPQAQAGVGELEQPKLTIVINSYPESNGKRNWTAQIRRVDKWDGLAGNCGGMTLARGEYWNRVAYAAEEARYLLGLRDNEPWILDFSDDIQTPEEWKGEQGRPAKKVSV